MHHLISFAEAWSSQELLQAVIELTRNRTECERYAPSMAVTLKRTALFNVHVRAGGRMVPFAGYDMPVQYSSIIAEARAVRDAAGMFDVSHMARLTLSGDTVLEYLEGVTSNDVAKLSEGYGQYSLLPNERGGVVDDIIVYRISATEFRMVVNASNHEKDLKWLAAHKPPSVEISDTTEESAMIAVQGPRAVDILSKISDAPQELRDAGAFGIVECRIGGIPVFAARSGYTGEDGYELITRAPTAEQLWNCLLNAGVVACGLGSRDTHRVEAGLPLYGHELTDDINPISAGLGWVVSKTKSFIGSDAIQAARVSGTAQKLQGVSLESKRLITPGMKVFVGGKEVGEVTSGVVSPVLDRGIAFAMLDKDVALGTPCSIEVRGKMEPGTVVSKRFFKRDRSGPK